MLGKLMKYEWKATWKLLLPLNLFVLLMSLLSYGIVQLSFFDSDNGVIVMTGIIVIFAYILSLFVIAVGSVIYLIYRFYTSVYGDEGYLLHTLPVDKHHIIIAKSVVSAAWVVLNTVIIYFSVAFLLSARTEIVRTFVEGFDYYVNIMSGNFLYDRKGAFTVFMTLIAAFFTLLARVLKITACVSLGQLSSNHKVLSAFAFYYGIYFVQRLFTVFYYVILELMDRISSNSHVGYSAARLGTSWAFSLISALIYCVIFYFVTWYVMEKKLNLD